MKRYQHRPEYELYDITKDPFELDNLADKIEYKQKKAELIRELESWMKQQKDTGIDKDVPRTPNKKRAQNPSAA